MCSAPTKPETGFIIPSLTIRSESGGATIVEPDLLPGSPDAIRSTMIRLGPYGQPISITAELQPSSILMMLKNARVEFTVDGKPVAAIVFKDGTELRLD